MRTVWTMGFVAAAALSFCFPDFIVFRFTQAVIWAIALLGLVLLCGVSGQFSFAQAALFGVGGYSAAIIGTHTPLSVYWGLPAALLMGYAAGWGLGRIAGGHGLWTQALVTYAFAIAFPQLLRWRLIEQWTGGVQGLYLDFPTPPGGISADRWNFMMALVLLAAGVMACREHDREPLRPGPDGGARQRPCRRRARHPRRSRCAPRSRASPVPTSRWRGVSSSYQYGYVGPTGYSFALSVQMLFGLVIGGMYSPVGAHRGRACSCSSFRTSLAGLGKGLSRPAFMPLLLIAAMVLMPTGMRGCEAASPAASPCFLET